MQNVSTFPPSQDKRQLVTGDSPKSADGAQSRRGSQSRVGRRAHRREQEEGEDEVPVMPVFLGQLRVRQ